MSYTKMNVEITRYLKENNLPIYGKSSDTKEQTEYRLRSYRQGRDYVFKKWLAEKKYRELISCAHGGWFNEDEFLVPLAQHFVKENDLPHLRLLCERGIRFKLEDLLFLIKNAKESPTFSQDQAMVRECQEEAYRKIDRYIGFLQQLDCREYLPTIQAIRDKTVQLQIRKSDLASIKFKG